MNYERMSAEIPNLYQISRETKGSYTWTSRLATRLTIRSEADLLNGLLGWVRNDTFGRMAEVCALWGAIVQANKHLSKVDRKTVRSTLYPCC